MSSSPNESAKPVLLLVASWTAVVAAALSIIGLCGALTSPDVRPGFSSTVLLVVLVALAPAVALCCVFSGRHGVAAGLLSGSGVLALGQGVATCQLLADPNSATRPELLLPASLGRLHATTGTWLLVIGYGLFAVAGMLAVRSSRPVRGEDELDSRDRQSAMTTAMALGIGIVLVLLLVPPWHSDNPYVPAWTMFEAAPFERYGGVVLLLGVIAVPLLVAGAPERPVRGGVLIGAGLGLVQWELPRLVTGLAVPGFSTGSAPYLLLAAALAFLLVGLRGARAVNEVDVTRREDVVVVLPGWRRLRLATALSGLLSALAMLLAALNPLVSVPSELAGFGGIDHGVLAPSAILVGVLAASLLVPRAAALVRPAFVVGCAVLPLAAAATIDGVATATLVTGVHATGWAWLIGAALLLGLLAVCCATVAGLIERDELDRTERRADLPVLAIGGLGGLLAVGAFALPVLRGAGFAAPGLWSNFRVSSWGLVFALVAVIVAVIVAGFSRRARGGALVVGAALVLGVHALELPLGANRVAGATAGTGFWATLAAVVVLLLCAAGCSLLPRRDSSSPI